MWGSEAGRPDDRQWLLSLAMDTSNVWLWIILEGGVRCRGRSEGPGWKSGAGVPGPHLRVGAAVVLPDVGWP